MNNILIIQTAFIGDVILSTSLVENILAQHPNAKISMLVRKGNEGLLYNHPFLNEVLVWEKSSGKFRNLLKIIRKVRERKFNIVINLHRYAASGLITVLSGANKKCGYDKNPFSFAFNHTVKHIIGDGRHEVERYQELTDFFCKRMIKKPRLYPSDADREFVNSIIKPPYVVVAPASVWMTKKLPDHKWVELIKKINPKFNIYCIGAQSDKSLCDKLISESQSGKAINLSGRLSLLQSAALMETSHMNYVNDSAPLHLASAMNAPVTAFFCSTIPDFGFGPLSDQSTIIETAEKLSCRPCGLHGKDKCPEGHFKCGNTIVIPELNEH